MSAPELLFSTVSVSGLGLIGASICRAARRAGVAQRLIGYDRDPAVRDRARDLGLADEIVDDPAAAGAAGLVILCVPVGSIPDAARDVAPGLAPGAILSDVGSVKTSVLRETAPYVPPGVHFIPAHPIAGTEYSGPDAGFAELFNGRWCILTPPHGSDTSAVAKLAAFWTALGAKVDEMEPTHHDKVLAVTSHIPHLIAYTMVGAANDLETVTQSEVIKYSASGFRDFTRIAASDPTMWRDVFLNNREATLEILGRFTEELFALQRSIRWGDEQMLFDYFTRTRAIRRAIVDAGQDTAAPDFGRRAPPSDDPEGR